jgi:CRP-like cAMP-binding protein
MRKKPPRRSRIWSRSTSLPGKSCSVRVIPGEHVYLVAKGGIELRVDTASGQQALTFLKAGTLFGEISVLTGSDRTATAASVGETDLWRLSMVRFNAALTNGESWAGSLLRVMARVLAERLVLMNRRIVARMEAPGGEQLPEPDAALRDLERLRDATFTEGLYHDLLFT